MQYNVSFDASKVRAGASVVEYSSVYVFLFKDAVVVFGSEWKGSLQGVARQVSGNIWSNQMQAGRSLFCQPIIDGTPKSVPLF